MATKTITLSNFSYSWSSSRPTSDYNSRYMSGISIPLFSSVTSITPSFSHSATKTTGDTLAYSRYVYYCSNAEKGGTTSSISFSSGTAITNSTALGKNTLHEGNNIERYSFGAYVSNTSSWYSAKLKTHNLSSASVKITYTPLDYTITIATRKGEDGVDDNF